MLHIATAARAARVLTPWLPDDPDVLAPLWHATGAAIVAAGRPPASSQRASADAGLDWPEVLVLARASNDEHVIKLVHAMSVQNAVAPRPVWLRAAAVALLGG